MHVYLPKVPFVNCPIAISTSSSQRRRQNPYCEFHVCPSTRFKETQVRVSVNNFYDCFMCISNLYKMYQTAQIIVQMPVFIQPYVSEIHLSVNLVHAL